ncbi:MAG: uracil-DNA glycosylase [Rhizobiaceae bacterium]
MEGQKDHTAEEIRSILLFHAEAGVDVLLNDEPVDRFAESRQAAPINQRKAHEGDKAARRAAPEPTPVRAAPRPEPTAFSNAAIPDNRAVEGAREMAAAASTLEALKQALEKFEGCNLRITAKHTVFADGNPEAKVMIIGEAPGAEEDRMGLPFVGRAGQLLDRMLASIGLDRTSVYITNMLAWRPPGNRTPTPHEIEVCRPFIDRHVALIKPQIIIYAGGVSAKALSGRNEGILKMRGRWLEHAYDGGKADVMPMLHPAYLLRQPAQKSYAWQDLLKIQARLSELQAAD